MRKSLCSFERKNLGIKRKKTEPKIMFENEEVLKEFTLNQPQDFSNYVNDQLVGIKSK